MTVTKTAAFSVSGIGMDRFYIIEPEPNSNAAALCKKIALVKGVKEVFLTEGACGYIIRTEATKENHKRLIKCVPNAHRKKVLTAISHIRYKGL